MIKVIEIEYIIDGLGHFEHTKLSGLSEGETFNIGNNHGYNVEIKTIDNESVVLKFNTTDNIYLEEKNELKLSLGESTRLLLMMKPSPKIEVKLLNVTETEKRAYI